MKVKTVFFLINFQFLVGLGFAQSNSVKQKPQNYEDTIALAKSMISSMEFSQLEFYFENYRAQNEFQAEHLTNDIMGMIEEKYFDLKSRMIFNLEIFIPENIHFDTYSDSLQYAKTYIDELGYSLLSRMLERYRFLKHTQPSLVNQEVLSYMEEKFNTLSNEN